MATVHPIGVFDSGYGGLTVLKAITRLLPQYDYVYLGDSARSPYGNRSFDTVYRDTLQCVKHLFSLGCRLVILACNTASSKALRTIQQKDLPGIDPSLRVLGVIRPTAEVAGKYSVSGILGVFATAGTVASGSYPMEISKFFPQVRVVQEACPMWVPLVENGEHEGAGADFFIQQHVQNLFAKSPETDVVILGCTHYPLLLPKIRQFSPAGVTLLAQDLIVSRSLADYLRRHPEIESVCTKTSSRVFLTTDDPGLFSARATPFYGEAVQALHVELTGVNPS